MSVRHPEGIACRVCTEECSSSGTPEGLCVECVECSSSGTPKGLCVTCVECIECVECSSSKRDRVQRRAFFVRHRACSLSVPPPPPTPTPRDCVLKTVLSVRQGVLFVRHPKEIVCRAGNAGGRLSSVSVRRSWSASDANSKALVYDILPWRTVPESKACSLDRVSRVSNWILTSCQPHRVASGQRPSVLTQLIGVDSRKRHTVLFVFQQPTAPPINQPTDQSKTVSKQVCNKPTNNPTVFQSKNNKK